VIIKVSKRGAVAASLFGSSSSLRREQKNLASTKRKRTKDIKI
jgi:hypothetical protein